jgi:hypothetical protein
VAVSHFATLVIKITKNQILNGYFNYKLIREQFVHTKNRNETEMKHETSHQFKNEEQLSSIKKAPQIRLLEDVRVSFKEYYFATIFTILIF